MAKSSDITHNFMQVFYKVIILAYLKMPLLLNLYLISNLHLILDLYLIIRLIHNVTSITFTNLPIFLQVLKLNGSNYLQLINIFYSQYKYEFENNNLTLPVQV